ncbi:MAG: type I secretion system permease/ATPase [Rhodocyclaceae bacterium]|nr:type I secretion system permease/ATPase [Rhodocyclaceae bacterium]MDZ4214463.1 type I secretion system permease/ATPase [Rhodocyclaceae bacterium]
MLPKGELTDILVTLRRVFYALGAFSFAINLLLLVPAIYMLQMYDRVLTSRNEGTLIFLTLLMVGLLALEAALEFVRSRVLVRTGAALDMQLDGRVFDAAFAHSMSGKEGNANQTLADLASLRQFLTGKGLLAFFDAPWTPIYLFVILLLSPWLGLFALLAAALLFVMAWFNERATGDLLGRANTLSAGAQHYASTSLRNAEVVDAMGMLGGLRQRWYARQNEFLAIQGEAAERTALIGGTTRFFRLVLQSGILGVGAYLVLQNQLTPGGMIAGSILLGRALAPVDLAIATWRNFVLARQAYARTNALLAAHPVQQSTVALPRPRGKVAVENLLLAAPGSREPILKGISFSVPAGALVGVVGASASGKSSLARALVGIWKPLSGAVRLDGADVVTWDRAQLGPWLGYLPQDVELFDGNIAENIARFGQIDSTQVVLAAQRAGVHEMILRLPDGYETQIGAGGTVLSGGQRQRIGLARALYGDPALIVLDEPNANLDEAGDLALQAALRMMKEEQRTVFVMTHRINVLETVDAVLILANGKIKAFGPREEIMKAAVQGVPRSLPAKKKPRSRRSPSIEGEAKPADKDNEEKGEGA